MSTLLRLIEVEGYALDVEGTEPRIRDLALGEMLGYERPRVIRELIERQLGDLPGIVKRRVVRRLENTGNLPSERAVDEYLLTEAEALFVAARSETPAGAAVLKKLIDVFVKARAGLLPTSTPSIIREEVARLEGRLLALERAVNAASERRAAKIGRELYDDGKPQRPTRDELATMLLAAAGNPKLRWTHRHQLALVAGWRSRPVLAELIASGAIVELRNPRRLVTRELAAALGRIEVAS